MFRNLASDYLEPSDWSKLSPFIREESYIEAQEILSVGETCEYIYFCKEGNIQLILNIDKTLLVRLHAGEIAGELPYLINPVSTVSVVAESGSKVVKIPHKNLIELFVQDRDFEYRFLKYVALTLAYRLSLARKLLRLKDAKTETVEHVTPLYVNGFSFKHLRDESDIKRAMILLHEVYISELAWKLVPGNPSRLRVETDVSGDLLLVDKFSDKAEWFGAFKNNELVGCFRVLRYPHHELSEYIDLPISLSHDYSCEINRLAVAKEFRNSVVTLLLLRMAVEYAFTIGDVIFCNYS